MSAHSLPAWTQLVQPDHPLIRGILDGMHRDGYTPGSLTRPFCSYRWVGHHDVSTFDDVHRTGQGNCMSLSAMLCSAAIAAGWYRSCVLVSGGGLMSQSLVVAKDRDNIATVTVHAWAILAQPGVGVTIVDPVKMEPEPLGDAVQFGNRLQTAAPVDRLFPMVFNNSLFRLFVSTTQTHGYLEELWKQ